MNSALILAGGLGTRLRPLTYAIPKPLLPIGEKPILELIITHLKKFGISNIYLSVNYKKELIKAYFQDGKKLGVNIIYIEEENKLGTAGPIGKLKKYIDDTFIIMNGDLYTDINIEKMLNFHIAKHSVFTIGVKDYSIQVPYGVMNIKNNNLLDSFTEKPQLNYLINAGVYICEASIMNLINDNESLDMPDLWNNVRKEFKDIFVYKFNESWVDVGRMEDYLKTQEDANVAIV
ncbi:NDP-sugar pyrophosphorylase family protein [Clostridium pascui]|uniref:nucleotidyltransferase family protein n=1 Tax=Clostridium pascui TaxID=46609 RepID=UPI00195AA8DF|nr:sugar phosphate nucleotidyltransferase [Clostridium pascui]MBM7869451.1 NDP-sugar pyrophosphorylase family protein [Clostridium pascui]